MILSIIILFHFNVAFADTNFTSVVYTKSGPVRGEITRTSLHSVEYAAFRSIKYGEAPTGYLRFKPPIPAEPWNETIDVIDEKSDCVQEQEDETVVSGSEDCLYLNVFTPVTNLNEFLPKLKAVMVWIYGGQWLSGTASPDMSGPEYMIERDVVFVSFNYRAGALGWLNLNHPNATGNAAFKDQVLVLKWVRANIAMFGGNPNNVTIFGSSSGAMSVGYHIISDASVGLFHAGISMSGVPLMPYALQTANISSTEWLGTELALAIGADSTDKDELLRVLYNATPEELTKAAHAIRQTQNIFQTILFGPTIENARISTDVFLSECPITKYINGNYSRVPQIIGFADEETLGFSQAPRTFTRAVKDAISMETYFGMDVPKILSDYVEPEKLTDDAHFREIVKVTSELLYFSGIDQTQRIFAASNDDKPIYYYHVSFYTNRSVHNWKNSSPYYDEVSGEYQSPEDRFTNSSLFLGPAHADDPQYILNIDLMNLTLGEIDPLRLKIYQVSTMWSNFAKYGNPTPDWIDEYPLGITWPNSGPEGIVLNIGDELVVEMRPINYEIEQMQSRQRSSILQLSGCSGNLGPEDFNEKRKNEESPVSPAKFQVEQTEHVRQFVQNPESIMKTSFYEEKTNLDGWF